MNQPAVSASPRVGITAIFRNEGPYIIEWLAHHRVIGVDAFFIADNASDDGSSELLMALDRLGYIRYLHFPTVNGQPPQLPAYSALMQAYAHSVDWMAIIDADEYLMPTGEHTLKGTLEALGQDPAVGAIAVNWANFGSAWHIEQPQGLVLENFPRRAAQAFAVNHHYKSIVRCTAFKEMHRTPHHFSLFADSHYVQADGAVLELHDTHGFGLSKRICWDRLRLNHYVVKSREEFDRRKSPKGSAASATRTKGEVYFLHHDQNEVEDPISDQYASAVRAEMQRIQQALCTTGLPIDPQIPAAGPLPMFKGIRGHVDKLRLEDNTIAIAGWALCGNGAPPESIHIQYGSQWLAHTSFKRVARPDVNKRYPQAGSLSGFHLSASIAGHDPIEHAGIKVWASHPHLPSKTPLVMPAPPAPRQDAQATGTESK